MMGGNEQVDARLQFDWEGLYLIDLSLYPHKVGAIIQYEDPIQIMDCADPREQLKLRLLKEAGWDIVSVKYSDFLKNPSKFSKELVQTLQEVDSLYQETPEGHQGAGHKGRSAQRSQRALRAVFHRLRCS